MGAKNLTLHVADELGNAIVDGAGLPVRVVFADPPTVSAATTDFLTELNSNFSTIVTEKLDPVSKAALIYQLDPAGMSDPEAQRIRKAINSLVYGNTYLPIYLIVCRTHLDPSLYLKESFTKFICNLRFKTFFIIKIKRSGTVL